MKDFTNIDNNILTLACSSLNQNEIKVWLCLNRFWNKEYRVAFPTREQISEFTGIKSVAVISNVTTSLQEKGFIKKAFFATSDRKYSNNTYYVLGKNTKEEADNVSTRPERKDKGVRKEFPTRKEVNE